MKRFTLILSFLLTSLMLIAQTVPFPPNYPPNGVIGPWGHTDLGTNWDTSPYIPLVYNKMPFRLMLPGDGNVTYDPATYSFNVVDSTKKYPLILFFHGIGEAGTDNNNQLKHGGKIHRDANLSGQYNEGNGFFALYPQSHSEFISGSVHTYSREVIEKLAEDANVDLDRIVIHGLSAGAQAVWEFTYNNPKLIAAALPMSGVRTPTSQDIQNTVYLPIWISQGGLDPKPSPQQSGQIRDMFLAEGGNVRYTLYPNGGHGIWNNTYNNSDFFPFMMRANKTNIHVFHGGERNPSDPVEICPGVPVNVRLGLTAGFDGYEWRKDGATIPGASGNEYIATEYGSYQARFRRGAEWTDWSVAVDIVEKDLSLVPEITTTSLSSVHLPALDGSESVELKVADDEGQYFEYRWSKVGSAAILGTSATYTASEEGEYIVSVKDISGCFTNYSQPLFVKVGNESNVPDNPSNLQAEVLSETEAELFWEQNPNPSNNESNFEVYRATTSGGPYTLVAIIDADASSYLDNGLSPDTDYFYIIRGVNNNGGSDATAEASIKTLVDVEAPTAPANLTAGQVTGNSVSLSWNESEDNVGVFKYDIYKNGVKVLATSETTATVYFLEHGQVYNFTVKARDAAGNTSVSSPQATAITVNSGLFYSYYEGAWNSLPDFDALTPVATGVVDNFTLDPRQQDDNFAFKFEGVIQCPADGWYTFYTTSDDGSKLYINGQQVVDNDGLHGSRERSGWINLSEGSHNIVVEYFEQGGGNSLAVQWRGPGFSKQSIPNEAFEEEFTIPNPPLAPDNLTATATAYDQINLTWSDNSDNESGFEVYRSENATGPFEIIATTEANATLFEDTELDPETKYFYRIKAVGPTGESDFNDDVLRGLQYEYYEISGMSQLPDFDASVPVAEGETANFDLGLRQRNDDFAFRFSGHISLPSDGEYTFYTRSDDGSKLYINGQEVVDNDGLHGPTERSGSINLTAGAHEIVVTFFERGGGELLEASYAGPGITKRLIPTSALKEDDINATTFPLPPAPETPISFSGEAISGTAISLSWIDNSDNEQEFEVYRSTNTNTDYRKVATVDAADSTGSQITYTDENLFVHVDYFYKVRAKGVGGISDFTTEIQVETLNTAPALSDTPDNIILRYDETKNIQISATDADGDPISFVAYNMPSFATLTDNEDGSGSIAIVPSPEDQGVFEDIILYAEDGFGGVDSVLLSIAVNDNYSPALQNLVDLNLTESDSTTLLVTASDQNSEDSLTFYLIDPPTFVTIADQAAGEATLIIDPSFSDAGVYEVGIGVHDQVGALDESSFTITVSDVQTSFTVLVNFGDNSNTPSEWNNTATAPNPGTLVPNLTTTEGTPSSIDLTLVTSWGPAFSGFGNLGAITGNNSGIYPDAVMRTYYFTSDNTDKVIKFSNLNSDWKYSFTFFGSREGSGTRLSTYRINNETVSLNAMGNTSNTVQINNIAPDANGEIFVYTNKAPEASYGYLNAMAITAHFDNGLPPSAPTNLLAEAISGDEIALSWSDQSVNETAFEVFRSINDTTQFTLVSTVETDEIAFEDADNLLPNTTYYYKVRAINAYGASAFSGLAVATTLSSPPVISPIEDVTVNVGEIYTINVNAEDFGGGPVTLSIDNLPGFGTFTDLGDGTGSIELSPSTADAGVYDSVKIVAENSSEIKSELYFDIIVVNDDRQNVYINFTNQANQAASPWNNAVYGVGGNTYTGLTDEFGFSTSISVSLMDNWNGVNDLGMTSGIYPAEVTKTAFWFDDNGTHQVSVSGLDENLLYDLTFFGSRNGAGDRTTEYTVAGNTVSLNASFNTDNVATINQVQPNASGEILITIGKTPAASFGYLNAMVIEAYQNDGSEPDDTPSDLTAAATSGSSIKLTWADNSLGETGFEIYRSTTQEGPFSLVYTTGAGATSYENSGLLENETYYYYVRAKYSEVDFSEPSSIISVSTYLFTVSLNFNVDNPAGAPWNNTNSTPEGGLVFDDLKDGSNQNTGIAVSIVEENPDYIEGLFGFSGDNPFGMITGDNSGIVPDNVMRSTYWLDQGMTAQLKVSNLDLSLAYNFEFFASRDGSGNRTTDYEVNGKTASLNAAFNTSATAVIESIEVDENGEAVISISAGQGSAFGYIGALMIHGYRFDGQAPGTPAAKALVRDEQKIEQSFSNSEILVYPNPFDDFISLRITGDHEGRINAIVRDQRGRKVFERSDLHIDDSSDITIDQIALPSGFYFLEIQGEGLEHRVLKLLKK